jgi:RNA polymerase-binding protein DksA
MSARAAKKSAGKATARKSAPRKKAAVKKSASPKKKTAGKKTASRKAAPKKAASKKKVLAKKAAPKKKAVAKKAPLKKVASKKKKVAAKKPAARKKVPAKKAPAKKAVKTKAPAKRKPRARELEPFRRRLIAKQRELMQTYAAFKGDSRDRMDDGTEDYIDYAVSSYAKEFMLSLTEIDRKQLRLVEEALRRIEKREYGSCQNCGTTIPPQRLEVAPWAVYCVRCQELDEQGLLVHPPAVADEPEETPNNEVEESESEEPEVNAKTGDGEPNEIEADAEDLEELDGP